jgi:ATP-dependent RNA helicase DDX60
MPSITTHEKPILQPLSADIRDCIQSYNIAVKQAYSYYIGNVVHHMRSLKPNDEQILPLTQVSFVQSSDYDDGSLEYSLHHHQQQQQSECSSISPFASPSGLTNEQFMSNFHPSMNSWDLAYELDLSSRIIPLIDVDARDHTNMGYYLNSYALDYFRHGSESLLISDNELERDEVYQLLREFGVAIQSISQSLKEILSDETKQTSRDDTSFFRKLDKKFDEVESTYWTRMHEQYK